MLNISINDRPQNMGNFDARNGPTVAHLTGWMSLKIALNPYCWWYFQDGSSMIFTSFICPSFQFFDFGAATQVSLKMGYINLYQWPVYRKNDDSPAWGTLFSNKPIVVRRSCHSPFILNTPPLSMVQNKRGFIPCYGCLIWMGDGMMVTHGYTILYHVIS